MDIKNKVVLITGASSGIGEATARLLTSQWARVILASRSTEKISALKKELPRSLAITVDMTDEVQIKTMIQAAVKQCGTIDILINNAGQGYQAGIEQINPDTFRQIFQLNVIGPLISLQHTIPIMRRQGGGVIINISSGTSVMAIPNVGAYSSTKRALNGITLTARNELAKDNIRVCLLHPYITETAFFDRALRASETPTWKPRGTDKMPPADSAEFVAQKILATIQSEEAEVFVHDWMRWI